MLWTIVSMPVDWDEPAIEPRSDSLKGMAVVAYIIADKSKLRLKIISRGAALIFLLYSASVHLLSMSVKPMLDTQSADLVYQVFLLPEGINVLENSGSPSGRIL